MSTNTFGDKVGAGELEHGRGQREQRWRIAAWTAAGLLLLLPLVAMQFTDDVVWSAGDFAFAAVLLLGVGIPFELAVRRTKNAAYRAAVGIGLAAAFLMVWANGAVGIIGSEGNAANLMYYGVVVVGVAAVSVARFEPGAMARAMLAVVFAFGFIAVIALLAGWGTPLEVLLLNGFFAALFAGSAWLFRKAKAGRDPADVRA